MLYFVYISVQIFLAARVTALTSVIAKVHSEDSHEQFLSSAATADKMFDERTRRKVRAEEGTPNLTVGHDGHATPDPCANGKCIDPADHKNQTAIDARERLVYLPGLDFTHKFQRGECPNWIPGSEVVGAPASPETYGEQWFILTDAEFADPAEGPSKEMCALFCERDPACRQAMYFETNQSCFLGIGVMNADTNGANDIECYAREFFNETRDLTSKVKETACDNFREGYGYDTDDAGNLIDTAPLRCQCFDKDCDMTDTIYPTYSFKYEMCSHWNGMNHLSFEGCMGRCDENPHCKAAEYDEKSHDCRIGLTTPTNAVSTHDDGVFFPRDSAHKTKCYAKEGFNEGGAAPALNLESYYRTAADMHHHAHGNATGNGTDDANA